jgi:DSF synthase
MPVQHLSGHPSHEFFRQLTTRYDAEHGAIWCFMQPRGTPCFSPELLSEMRRLQSSIEQQARKDHESRNPNALRYQILASRIPGVFNLGGDLPLFVELIRKKDGDGLMNYARSCIDMLHPTAINYNLPITTISLVQGEALGGGFEAALSSNVLIAERRAQMGLPEILFNLFPGMGAYTLLARRLDPARAEKIILSGKIYSAMELYELGVVDILVDDGEGEKAVYAYIKKQNRAPLGYHAVREIRHSEQPVVYADLLKITTRWVETALMLDERDLRTMQRLARSQQRLADASLPVHKEPAPQIEAIQLAPTILRPSK